MEPTDKKLLDQVRDAIRLKHYSIRTEQSWVNWIILHVFVHTVPHPAEMTAASLATIPAMISRHSASSSELKLRQIQGLVSRDRKPLC